MTALYEWPKAAAFGRPVPKTKFYEHAPLTAAMKQKFVDEVQRITWAFKLADGTVNLRGTDAVPEIQIFIIDAKGDDVSDAILTAIDKAVPSPIIFEINRQHDGDRKTRMVGAHKQAGAGTRKLGPYLSTPWQPSSASRTPLPPALDLPRLYDALLTRLLPFMVEPGEKVAEALVRVDEARRLERELASLDRRLRNEPQFNRKVELRRQIREHTAALNTLTTPDPSTNQEASWTS
jgi:hypothetical protein